MHIDWNKYKIQRALSSEFDTQVISILSGIFDTYHIETSSIFEDKYKCSDFKVILPSNQILQIGSRLRKFQYFQFKNEFTIRVESEYKKILSGLGDYMLYGFVDKLENEIIKWTLIDLDVFRFYEKDVKKKYLKNDDGGYNLYVFQYSDFPEQLIYTCFDASTKRMNELNLKYLKTIYESTFP